MLRGGQQIQVGSCTASTGSDIRDARFVSCNLRLELKLERLFSE